MIQTICQWVILINMIFNFIFLVRIDINGRPAREPTGFAGFVGTCVAITVIFVVLYFGGCFSTIFPMVIE